MFSSFNSWFELGIGVSGVIGGLIGGICYAKKKLSEYRKKEIEDAAINAKGSSFQTKHTIIHETLSTLRVKANADRARIAHFHNGGKFLDGTAMKKFSITHESCERGVPYDGSNLQNILVTMFWDLIEDMRKNSPEINITDEMGEGYFRSYNKSNGIEAYAILPIMKQDLYIGFVELEWFEKDKIPTADLAFGRNFVQSRDYIELELALR